MLRYDRTDNEIVLCREYPNDFQAHMALAALEQEGIPATIDNEIFSTLYPVGVGNWSTLRLMVRRRDLDRARRIVDQLDFSD